MAVFNFGDEHGFHRSHNAFSSTIRLGMVRRGVDVCNSKSLELVPKETTELGTSITGEPCRKAIAHQPAVMEGSTDGRSLVHFHTASVQCVGPLYRESPPWGPLEMCACTQHAPPRCQMQHAWHPE